MRLGQSFFRAQVKYIYILCGMLGAHAPLSLGTAAPLVRSFQSAGDASAHCLPEKRRSALSGLASRQLLQSTSLPAERQLSGAAEAHSGVRRSSAAPAAAARSSSVAAPPARRTGASSNAANTTSRAARVWCSGRDCQLPAAQPSRRLLRAAAAADPRAERAMPSQPCPRRSGSPLTRAPRSQSCALLASRTPPADCRVCGWRRRSQARKRAQRRASRAF